MRSAMATREPTSEGIAARRSPRKRPENLCPRGNERLFDVAFGGAPNA